jgi:hypothetical protein
MTIVVAGSIGRFPVGGHAWIEMQYLLGLQLLGYDVFYLEDCGDGSYVYDWETQEVTTELEYPTNYIKTCLDPVGFDSRWMYRAGDRSMGMALDDFRSVCSRADLLIFRNCTIPVWREDYNWPRRRLYIDADPGFAQIHLANGDRNFVRTLGQCDRLFTVGQRIGAPDCAIPAVDRRWLSTVAPVALPYWPLIEAPASHFTTIMQWHSRKEVSYDGVTYGNKDREFQKFQHLPQLTTQPFRIALTGAEPEQLSRYGWEIDVGWHASLTPSSYQQFIQRSRAEFAVAKHGYVAMRGGWFSDRSVCYLASGRPVLVQDTGQGDSLPTGEGIVTFRDAVEAVRGIEVINSQYERHCRTARAIAEQYFATERVLPSLLERAMN